MSGYVDDTMRLRRFDMDVYDMMSKRLENIDDGIGQDVRMGRDGDSTIPDNLGGGGGIFWPFV